MYVFRFRGRIIRKYDRKWKPLNGTFKLMNFQGIFRLSLRSQNHDSHRSIPAPILGVSYRVFPRRETIIPYFLNFHPRRDTWRGDLHLTMRKNFFPRMPYLRILRWSLQLDARVGDCSLFGHSQKEQHKRYTKALKFGDAASSAIPVSTIRAAH